MKIYFFIFILILILILQLNNVKSDSIFNSIFGEWNEPENWLSKQIPTIEDNVFLNKDQIVYNLIGPIEANIILVGEESIYNSNTTFITQYGITTGIGLQININSTFIVDIKSEPKLNQDLVMNLPLLYNNGDFKLTNSHFYAPDTSVSNQYNLDIIYNSSYQVKSITGAYATTVAQFSNIDIKSLDIFLQSQFVVQDSNITFNDLSGSVIINTSAVFKTYDSNLIIYPTFYIGQYTQLFIQNTTTRFFDNSTLFVIEDGALIINLCDDFISDKQFITSGSNATFLGIANSNISFLQKSSFQGQSEFIVSESTFNTKEGFYFKGQSKGSFNNSNMVIYGNFEGREQTYFQFLNSDVTISNLYGSGDRYLGLYDDTWMYFNGGIVNLDSYLTTSGKAYLIYVQSQVSISQDAVFSDLSVVQANDTNLNVGGVLTLYNKAMLVSFRSSIVVKSTILFNNQSTYLFDNVDIHVNGYFIDNTQPFDEIQNSFHHSNLTINGYFSNNGAFYFNYSNLISNGDFINGGGFESIESDINIQNNFTNNNNVYLEKSKLTISSGSIIIGNESNMTCKNSLIEILEGKVLLSPKSIISLQNTTMLNKKGSLQINGDIIVDENGLLTNSASFNLNSNIYLQNPNGQESFTNNGELNIESNESNQDSIITNILINFINQGGSVNIGKEKTVMLNLTQDNSNLTMKFENTTLLIQNDFNSFKDSVTLTVGNNNLSSIIIVNNTANIENSKLIIRIPVDLNNDPRNTTILTYSQLNGNGFNNVGFKTYDPKTGEEKEIDNCKHQLHTTDTSMSLLLNSKDECGSNKSSKISTGAIIGIVVGIAGAAAIIGVVVFYKTKLPKHQRLKYRLKQLNQQSQTTTSTQA